MISFRKLSLKAFLFIFTLLTLLEVLQSQSRWCTKREPAYKTRVVERQGFRQVMKTDWIGFKRLVHEFYPYTELEYYMTMEVRETCCAGYELRDGNCEPICRRSCSENSYCYLPDFCKCLWGYVSKEHNGPLECVPECIRGCPLNSICSAPNYCSCDRGYAMGNTSECLPVCTKECPPHSNCVGPDLCRCKEGYQMISLGQMCEPICKDGCPTNSVCLQPDVCQCNEGYQLKSNSEDQKYCEPICEQDCSDYGKCVRPGVCECLPGFEESKVGGKICQPRCSKGCVHGFCFAPEICVCDPGYLMGPNATCSPVCSLGCVHGECVEPEICRCFEGYRLQMNSVNICEPVCKPPCENGECVAPNVCACWNKYQWAFNSSTVCAPTCSPECVHGDCNASFECSCHTNYEVHHHKSHECMPVCKGCHNGVCLAPGVCQCNLGYVAMKEVDGSGQALESCMLAASPTIATTTIKDSSLMPFGSTIAAPKDSVTTSSVWEIITSTNDDQHENDYNHSFNSKFVPFHHCQSRCKCWSDFDELVAIKGTSCHNMCVDEYDQPCLDLTQCRCDLNRLDLVCKNIDGQSSERIGEQPEKKYSCIIRNEGSIVDTTTEFSPNQSERKANDRPFQIWWIILIGAIVLLLGIVTTLIWRRFRSQASNGFLLSAFNAILHSWAHKLVAARHNVVGARNAHVRSVLRGTRSSSPDIRYDIRKH